MHSTLKKRWGILVGSLLLVGISGFSTVSAQAATPAVVPAAASHCTVLQVDLHGDLPATTTCQQTVASSNAKLSPARGEACTGMVLYQDAWFGGSFACINGTGTFNLTTISLCGLCWSPGSFNDQVSSFKSGSHGGYFSYDINNGGASYWFGANQSVGYVGDWWNDEFSSVWISA